MALTMSTFLAALCLHCWIYLSNFSGQTVDGSPLYSSLHKSCGEKLDLIIILDSSGSVGINIWPQEVDFAKQIVNQFTIGPRKTHVGIIDFSTSSIVRVDLNKPEGASKDSIQKALDKLKTQFQSGVTYIDYALETAIKMYKGVPTHRRAPRLLIVVTDGQATQRGSQTGFDLMKKPVLALKSLFVNRIAIGVGTNVNQNELEHIASDKSNVIQVSEFKVILQKINRLLKVLCPALIIDEGNILDANGICVQTIDLIVVLDCSGSIGQVNWERQLSFIRKLLQHFEISPEESRIGLVVFNEKATIYANITEDGSSKNNVLSVLSNMENLWEPYMRTYTDIALSTTFEMIRSVHRLNPRVLLLTDGETTHGRQENLKKQVEALSDNGVEMFSVGIGPRINSKELLFICKSKDRVFVAKNFNELPKFVKKICTRVCRGS